MDENQGTSAIDPQVEGTQGENPNEETLDDLLPIHDEIAASEDDVSAPDDDAEPDEGTSDNEGGKPAVTLSDEVTVDIDGEKVKFADLKKEYARREEAQRDYTVKTMQLADERRDFVVRAQAAVAQEKQAISNIVPQLIGTILDQLAPQRNAAELYQLAQDPQQYALYQAQQEQRKQLMDWAYKATHGELQTAQQQQQDFERQVFDAENQKIAQLPFYNDDWARSAEAFAIKQGVPPSRVSALRSAAALKIVHDAMQWNAAQAKLKDAKVKPSAPKQIAQRGRPSGQNFQQSRQFAELEKRAKAGDKAARNRVLSSLMPLQDG